MTTIKTGNRRLLKLAAFLEKLPRKRFDYRYFTSLDWDGSRDTCGTTGCAVGWAATIPTFQRLGLQLRDGNMVMSSREIFSLTHSDWIALFQPLYRGEVSGGTFRLGEKSTPKQVAKHIRRFVARRDEGGAQ